MPALAGYAFQFGVFCENSIQLPARAIAKSLRGVYEINSYIKAAFAVSIILPPTFFKVNVARINGGIAQLARAPALQAGCQGFESPYLQ